MRDLIELETQTVGGGDAAISGLLILGGLATFYVISKLYPKQPACHLVDVPYNKVIANYDPITGEHVSNTIIDYTVPEWVCN